MAMISQDLDNHASIFETAVGVLKSAENSTDELWRKVTKKLKADLRFTRPENFSDIADDDQEEQPSVVRRIWNRLTGFWSTAKVEADDNEFAENVSIGEKRSLEDMENGRLQRTKSAGFD